MKKLIIVCDEKAQKYANYLRQLISSNDDEGDKIIGLKDGDVEAVVWTEGQYRSNSPQLNSTQHIIFIGDNEIVKEESANIKYLFEKYGMKYGWVGKRAVALVDSKNLDEKSYDEFLSYCQNIGQKFEKQEYKLFNINEVKKKIEENKKDYEVKKKIITPVAAGLLFGVKGIGAGVGALGFGTMGKIKDQQYIALMTILYLQDLAKFMEN